MTYISSLRNPRVAAALKLRTRAGRRKQGRFLIDGARELHQGLRGGVQWDEVFVCDELCRAQQCQVVLEELSRRDARLIRVSAAVFAKLSFGDRKEGLLGIAMTPSLPGHNGWEIPRKGGWG